MSLYCGTVGQKILAYAINSPRFTGAVKTAARIATLGIWNPSGITTETFRLGTQARIGERIEIKTDGFYRGQEWLAGNSYISHLYLANGISGYTVSAEDTPEYLSRFTFALKETAFDHKLRNLASATLSNSFLALSFAPMILFMKTHLGKRISLPPFAESLLGHDYSNHTMRFLTVLTLGMLFQKYLYPRIIQEFETRFPDTQEENGINEKIIMKLLSIRHVDVALAAIGCTIGPAVEEAFYRGLLFNHAFGASALALLGTSVMFSWTHGKRSLALCLSFAVNALAYGAAYSLSDFALIIPIVMHTQNNLGSFKDCLAGSPASEPKITQNPQILVE